MNVKVHQGPQNFSLHPDYVFTQKVVIIGSANFDRAEYMHHYAHRYDLYDPVKQIIELCNNDWPVSQDLRIDRLEREKADHQIWDELKVRNCQPNALVDRLIKLTFIGKEKLFPLIIGYFEEYPVVVEPGANKTLEVRKFPIGTHQPGTYLAYENASFKI